VIQLQWFNLRSFIMSTKRHQALLLRPLTSADDLHRWVRLFCNINVPRTPVCSGHSAPFEYLVRAYFEPASDQIVHAPRGGGKTRLAAVATLLDLLHKPGISVRVLGGSLEQSLRLWEHLLPDLTHCARDLLGKRIGSARRVTLLNGSSCAVLAQSEQSVRGIRVQKLRCDEVELFKPDIWEAAQLVTKTKTGFCGAVDALSTFHEPSGLMQRLLEAAPANGTPVVRWCLIDVLETCPPERECASCPLLEDCNGAVKRGAGGFVTIDDAIRMKRRVSLDVWQSEMLCRRPSTKRAVFADFDVATHVRDTVALDSPTLSLAIDFGYAGAFVCLWVLTDGKTTFVIDEHVEREQTLEQHLSAIVQKQHGQVSYVACDPAGRQRNGQTGLSDVQQLRRAGFVVRYIRSDIADGINRIRTALRPALGEPTLFIHPRCVNLLRALAAYRYADTILGSRSPIKDGVHDHPVDALRYHFVNAQRTGLRGRTY
jgi:Terminase RNaseH-like domain